MTRNEIKAIPVGRPLDLAVAKTVMGWQFCEADEPLRLHTERGGCVTEADGPMKFSGGCIPNSWKASTQIDDAMDVLCKARGPDRKWFAVLPRGDGYLCHIGSEQVYGVGGTISEAVCRAALVASL